MSLPAILVNYNFTPKWLSDYEDIFPITILDKSDDGVERDLEQYGEVIKCANIGQVDYSKISYLVDNYDNLPNTFLWAKTNIYKFISKPEFELVKHNQFFTPLLTQFHVTYTDGAGWVNYYEDGWYWERNNDWYVNQFQPGYFRRFKDFARAFDLPSPPYIPFAPGGNYILTKEKVHKYPKSYYEKMRNLLPYCREPVEAQMCERSYGLMWEDRRA